MRQFLYLVYDAKVQTYAMPYFAQTDAAAQRSFADAVNQDGTMISRHPEDFSLVVVGSVDDGTGLVSPSQMPTVVCTGLQAKRKET